MPSEEPDERRRLGDQSDVAEAHARRRAVAHQRLVARLLESGENSASRADAKVRKRRRKARMANEGGNWHAAERRRLEGLDEHGQEVRDLPCTSCPTMVGEMEFQILQPFRYNDFPFDRQTIVIEIVIDGADLYTCRAHDALAIMGLTTENAPTALLPNTGTWILEGGLDAITLRHPTDEFTGEPVRERCLVEIKIQRDWAVFFVKQIATMLLVTAGGLMALFMQPGDLFGDRCAQIVVSVLIVLTSMQMDIGLGKLSYLICIRAAARTPDARTRPSRIVGLLTHAGLASAGAGLDYFNIMQLLVLLVALFQTMVLHRLDHAQHSDLVIMYDHVFRVLIPILLWPCATFGMILLGLMTDKSVGRVLLALGFVGSFLIGGVWIHRLLHKADDARKKAVEQARSVSADTDDESYFRVLQNLFQAFDLDGGGSLDVSETRNLLAQLYPEAPRSLIGKAMLQVHKYVGKDESLDEASFLDAYAEAMKVFREDEQFGKTMDDILKSTRRRSNRAKVVAAEDSASRPKPRMQPAIAGSPPRTAAEPSPVRAQQRWISQAEAAVGDVVAKEAAPATTSRRRRSSSVKNGEGNQSSGRQQRSFKEMPSSKIESTLGVPPGSASREPGLQVQPADAAASGGTSSS